MAKRGVRPGLVAAKRSQWRRPVSKRGKDLQLREAPQPAKSVADGRKRQLEPAAAAKSGAQGAAGRGARRGSRRRSPKGRLAEKPKGRWSPRGGQVKSRS